MAKPIIAIIGLGLTGASLGLGLQRTPGNFEVVGHDKNPDVAQQARKVGAVQRTEWNLHAACERADMIVLAVPVGELAELFTHIGPDLKPTTLVFAIGKVMQPALDIAAQQLANHTHFVVGHPILSGVGSPLTVRADLFDEVTFCLASGPHADASAIQLASDFMERMGAKPFFVDAQEHDGIMAGVELLPQLVAAAQVRMNTAAASWRESRRLAGRQFAQATELDYSAEQLFSALLGNRENMLLRIQQLQRELTEWRELLNAEPTPGQPHPLLAALKAAVDAREEWAAQAMLKNWEVTLAPEVPQAPGAIRQMFFGNLMGRAKNRL
ncbi:MAG: prephenate dehydrogenase [Caldilineaceae bacterium]